MALEKQSVPINFAQGLDTKTDPFQVPPGKFLALENTVFSTGQSLVKRNGFANLASLPNLTSTFLTTFNGGLTAIGESLSAYSEATNTWSNKGNIQPAQVDVLPLIRSNTNQPQADASVASNGLVCTVFTDNLPSGTVYKYAVANSTDGQNVIAPQVISGATGSPRVFVVGNYFFVVYSAGTILKYFSISTAIPVIATVFTNVSAQYTPASTVAFDGVVVGTKLFIAWNASDVGGAIRIASIDQNFLQSNFGPVATFVGTQISLCADMTLTNPIIYISFYDSATSLGYTMAVNTGLVQQFAPVAMIAAETSLNLASSAMGGVCTLFYEVANTYSYNAVPTNFIKSRTITQAGVAGVAAIIIRSVGLASKSFVIDGVIYVLVAYDGKLAPAAAFQPTYFLINAAGQVIVKLAYSNGGGYVTLGLPSVTVTGTIAQFAYLIKDLIEPVNKEQGAASSSGIYSQLGVNLASIDTTDDTIVSSEIGKNLNISGGILWSYDGFVPVEQNFNLWPDNVFLAASNGAGTLTPQQYYYVATYEWADNQGNVFRSAPSIPVGVNLVGPNDTVTISIPTLRLTYKLANPVKIVLYRWSTAQQVYYRINSQDTPLFNDPSVDSVSFVDLLPDTSIIGNTLLYTTGGVVENIGPPASSVSTLYKSRLFLVDAENRNLLWYSKQVIESTPVEMSDLFTIFIAPTAGAQGDTGPMTALSALDDKLIIFKKDAIYYIVGTGPDNTGANNDFSEPNFISSTIGCANQNSIVFTPHGLMFQSDKGIWLLARDLSTQYIGAPVEAFNNFVVKSAINVPGTNQVRFTLSNGITLMYDYYYNQWGTFVNVPAISSTLYEGLHTYINALGQTFQQQPGIYQDGSKPVLMSFESSWFNMAGLQGYERFYFFYLLAKYLSPHKLSIKIAFDYNDANVQSLVISPDNYGSPYGGDTLYGTSSPYGGPSNIEQWRIFPQVQKCESFKITLSEVYDASFGVAPGAGLTISGLNLIIGAKSSYTRLRAARSIG